MFYMFEIMQTYLSLIQHTILIFSQVILSQCYLENPGYKKSFILPLAHMECSHRAINELHTHYVNE